MANSRTRLSQILLVLGRTSKQKINNAEEQLKGLSSWAAGEQFRNFKHNI